MNKVLLGLDPGLAETGWGVLSVERGRYRHIDHGSIVTDASLSNGKRLSIIYERIIEVIDTFKPQRAGIESLFFAKNRLSAIPVAQARGVLLLALEQRGVPSIEYPPQEIKQAITGNGRAEKMQVQELVKILLSLPEIPKPDHAADALAAAICCCNSITTAKLLTKALRG
ncbi:MAG TPA: crossover junction endodeoxyribonuclease RuvC [Spirochaetia bacterium]|jgi:crossover junction endodeoxyribonuclease RuvC|nr:crossover junction endodeoxyribonuclease RuvC [Spirochaetia bacterium]